MQLLLHQLREQIPFVQLLFFTLLLPIMLLHLALGLQQVVPPDLLLRDVNAQAHDPSMGSHFFRGAFTNLGILLWWAAATVSAFTYFLLHRLFHTEVYAESAKAFFLYMALFTALLTLDDLFMLHEEVFPVHLGVPELAVYAAYGALTAGLIHFVHFLVRTDFLVLMLALGFFAFSMLIDEGMLRFLLRIPGRLDLLIEDTMKMLGIVCWLVFLLRTATQQLQLQTIAAPPESYRTDVQL